MRLCTPENSTIQKLSIIIMVAVVVVVLLLLLPLLPQVDQSALNKAIEELRASGMQVFVSTTDPGVRPSLPQGVRLLDYGSSMSQAAELVTHICHMDQVSSFVRSRFSAFFFFFLFFFRCWVRPS